MNDFFLDYLILCAEKGVNIGVTLLVKGELISGTIISYNDYFELLSQILDSTDLKTVIKTYNDSINKPKEITDEDSNDELNLEHNFIHIKDVSVLSNMNYNIGNLPMRIKLSDVSGFHFGTMKQ